MNETFFTTKQGRPDISSIIIWSCLLIVSVIAIALSFELDTIVMHADLSILALFTAIFIYKSIQLFTRKR